MNKQPSVDDWFKKQFEGFAPDAPDVWGSVQQGIQAGQATSSAASVVAKSSVKIATKWIIGAAVVATVTTAVVYKTLQPAQPVKITAVTSSSEQQVDLVQKQRESKIILGEDQQTASTTTPLKSVNKGTDKLRIQKAAETLEVDQVSNELSPAATSVMEFQAVVVPLPISNDAKQTNNAEQKQLDQQYEIVKKEVEIKSEEQPSNLKPLTTVFTPNGDGLNDEWVIEWEGVQYSFIIVDNKGNKVFESKPNQPSWNGINGFTGEPCEKGNYIFVIRYQRNGSDNQEQKTGLVKINY